jgi:ubiquinone/menaquinone biosynthesis C-methylase UbiE
MFSDMPATLAEFHRVLKPGGLLYVNANSLGWYLHLAIDRGIINRDWKLANAAMRMILRTLLRRTSQVVVFEGWLRRALNKAGFSIVQVGTEGQTVLPSMNAPPVPPAYPGSYYGVRSIIEVLARKPTQQ